MKQKTKKRLLWGCGILVSLVILFVVSIVGIFFYLTRDNRIAKDPEKIANEADYDLPAYVVVSQQDNLERPASAWSSYHWELTLKEPLTEDGLRELDKLVKKDSHWKYYPDSKTYVYGLEEDDRNFSIYISVNDGKVSMYYEWWDILS